MDTRRWLNQSQPQMLQSATLLLYLNAFFALLNLGSLRGLGLLILVYVLPLVGPAAGFGIANDRKWGYQAALVIAIVPLVITVASLFHIISPHFGFVFNTFIKVLFQVLLVALVAHPTSRSYQKIWFK